MDKSRNPALAGINFNKEMYLNDAVRFFESRNPALAGINFNKRWRKRNDKNINKASQSRFSGH